MNTYKSVAEYIKNAEPDKRALLESVRELVHRAAPKAVEGIAYGMPSYKLDGKPLFYFAAMKGHLGIYPTAGPVRTCAAALKDFSTSKGCVRIPYTVKLPKTLITLLIKTRVKEIRGL